MKTKFQLRIQEVVQGKFELKEVNFAFVFQVNCPGCFIYGIPTVNDLYKKYGDSVGFLGISTAFEDFDLNTERSLKKLLQTSELVGETMKYFSQHSGTINYMHPIDFPVAMDKLSSPDDFLEESNLAALCNLNPEYKNWPSWEQQLLKDRVKLYYRNVPWIAETFVSNQFRVPLLLCCLTRNMVYCTRHLVTKIPINWMIKSGFISTSSRAGNSYIDFQQCAATMVGTASTPR